MANELEILVYMLVDDYLYPDTLFFKTFDFDTAKYDRTF